MRTVPTLCATGSIVGAAGVGCTFGQTQQIPGTRDSSIGGAGVANNSNGYQSTSITPLRTNPRSSSGGVSLLPLTPEQRTQKTSVQEVGAAKLAFSSQGSTLHTPAKDSRFADQESADLVGRQPTRSQRLPGFNISAHSSPVGSSGHGSISRAHSFGSGSPFIPPEPSESHRRPNKLVKRSLSQHLVHNSDSNEPSKIIPTLDRPATRRTRLAILSRRSFSEDDSEKFPISHSGPGIYQPFFRLEAPQDITSTSFGHKDEGLDNIPIRRIHPLQTDRPILLCPRTVSSSVSEDFDCTEFRKSLYNPRGIITFSSPGPSTASRPEGSRPSPAPRRSFSISDLLSRVPSTKRQPRKLQAVKGRRLFSAPLFSMHDDRDSSAADYSQKRRRAGSASNLVTSSGSPRPGRASAEHEPEVSRINAARRNEPSGDDRSTPHQETRIKITSATKTSPASNASVPSVYRRSRHSTTPSDNASSLIGSDYDGKVFSSADEDEVDKQSDSLYDSLRTGVTRSSSGFRAPGLETLFDKGHDQIPERAERPSLTPARNLESRLRVQANPSNNVDEDVSNSTPARTVIPETQGSRRSSSNYNPPITPIIGSSPPQMPDHLSLGKLGWHSEIGDEDDPWAVGEAEEDWDDDLSEILDDDDDESDTHISESNPAYAQSSAKSLKYFKSQKSEQEQRNSLFDWSEHPPTRFGQDDTPPRRPNTVHGKKRRGGKDRRPTGYRAVSGLHARSQSVPALADLANNRTPITSKFGTWGIGSKGVTEDWNEDFEFDDEAPTQPPKSNVEGGQAILNRGRMVVPDSIKAQQTNVLANIGLLKEWGLLIEELKELRNKTVALNLEADRYIELFDEVDAMIDLADQEVEDEGLPQRSPRQFPVTDLEGLEQWSSSPAAMKPTRPDESDDDVVGAASTSKASNIYQTPEKGMDNVATRPRNNSEAVAESVIRALQTKGKSTRHSLQSRERHRKVPFDTATLRHIVPYVSGLSKKVRQILRDTEGLQNNPSPRRGQDQRSPEYRLRQAFIDPDKGHSEEGSSSISNDDAIDNRPEEGLVSLMKMTNIE